MNSLNSLSYLNVFFIFFIPVKISNILILKLKFLIQKKAFAQGGFLLKLIIDPIQNHLFYGGCLINRVYFA